MKLAPLMVGLLAAARPAAAQPEADACRAGLAHERAGALPRAFVELSRCSQSAEATAALARVKKKLAAGRFAPVSFSLTPARAELRIAPFTDGGPLREPHTLWLPFGTHRYLASAPGHSEVRGEIVVDSTARIHLQIELEAMTRAQPPRAVDFEADGPAVDAPIVVADPKPKKLPSLIPKRFRGGLDGEHGSAAGTRSARRGRGTRGAPRWPDFSWPWILTWGL